MATGEIFFLQGHLLTTFVMEYRRSLEVDAAQDAERCVACGRLENHFATDEGETVYRRTGVCESCKDVLQNPMSTAKQKRTQCMSLTDAGCGVAQRWIVFSEAKRRLQFYSEAEFCEAENIAMGRETLPMARR